MSDQRLSDQRLSDQRLSDAEGLMWRLGTDPFLSSTFANVTVCSGEPDLARLRYRLERASLLMPRLRQRVSDRGQPTWEEDPYFDVARHVKVVDLPRNSSMRAAFDLATLAASVPFDTRRPLWEFTLIRGLRGDRSIVVQKMHHCVADGEASLQLSLHFLDFASGAVDPPMPTAEQIATATAAFVGAAPTLGGQAVKSSMTLARQVLELLSDPVRLPAAGQAVMNTARALVAPMLDNARSTLWRSRSTARHLEALQVPLDPVLNAAKRLGATLNIAFLTAAAEAAGRYHRELGHEVETLRASMAISTRTKASGGNAFTLARLSVPTREMTVSERFQTIAGAADAARREASAAGGGLDSLASLAANVPTPALTRLARAQAQTVDFATSNLRAAPFPMYIAGARVDRNHPIGPLAGVAFNLTLMSYCGSLDMGLNVDTAAIERPALLRKLLIDAFRRLGRAT